MLNVYTQRIMARLQEVMPNATWLYSLLHREALTTKSLPSEIDRVMKYVIRIVKSTKSHYFKIAVAIRNGG